MNRYVTLNKSGNFYNCFGRDAMILHYLFHYKIVNNKTGFPISSLDKVKNALNEYNINYIINGDETIEKDFESLNKYDEYVLYAESKVNIDKRIDLILSKINDLEVKDINKLLDFIEERINIINESR